MYTFKPGVVSETWLGFGTYRRVVRSWQILDPSGNPVAQSTSKRGAVALCHLLNNR